jgi:hypothetical protein
MCPPKWGAARGVNATLSMTLAESASYAPRARTVLAAIAAGDPIAYNLMVGLCEQIAEDDATPAAERVSSSAAG